MRFIFSLIKSCRFLVALTIALITCSGWTSSSLQTSKRKARTFPFASTAGTSSSSNPPTKDTIRIRDCQYGDLGSCAELIVSSFYSGNSIKPPWLQLSRLAELNRIQQSFSYDKSQHRMILATNPINDSIVGFVDVDKRPPNRPTSYSYNPRPYLSDLCVDPECRRQGIARLLVEAAQDFCEGEELYIRVEANNEAAVNLYLGMGYANMSNPDCDDGSMVILHRSLNSTA